MSAGGITYDMVLPRRVATLPSVEMWGTNMNILKDPKKSVFTRRIDKVGETQEILNMQDASGDRICEMIKVYARGINPMVGVNYSNYGTNGGQNRDVPTISGAVSTSNCTAQASLPYKAFDNGAFRPPILRQEQLMPLSRQPRVWTYAFTNPSFPNFVKKMSCSTEQAKSIKKEDKMIRTQVRPTATYTLDNIIEPYEVNYVITNPIKISAHSGIRTMDLTTTEVKDPQNSINSDYTVTFAQTQKGSDKINKNAESTLNIEKYIIDNPLEGNITTNPNLDIYLERHNNPNIRLKDPLHSSVQSGVMRPNGDKYLHQEENIERKLPIYSSHTGIGSNTLGTDLSLDREKILDKEVLQGSIYVNKGNIGGDTFANSSRNYKLIPKLQKGSFHRMGSHRPMQYQDNLEPHIDIYKQKLRNNVSEQMNLRYPV